MTGTQILTMKVPARFINIIFNLFPSNIIPTLFYIQVGGGVGTSQFSVPSDGGNKLALPESRGLGELVS